MVRMSFRPRRWGRARPRPLTATRARSSRWRDRIASWRTHRDGGDLALVLELLSRELRGGATLASATGSIDPAVDLGLGEVHRRLACGGSLGEELDRWTESLAPADGALVRGVLRLGIATGAALADALDRAALILQEREELVAELRSLSAQSRASAFMIAAAPPAFLLVLGVADPRGLTMLLTSPLGWFCLVVGLALDVVGFWWMRRLVEAVR